MEEKKSEIVENKTEEKNKSELVEKEILKEEVKKEDAKTDKKFKKTEAIVNGLGLHISKKHSVAICNFIRGKNIDKAIEMLGDVLKFKKPVPMRGEIPHKKGIMSGRYPLNAAKEFIVLLKSLRANAIVNELELEKLVIFCKADLASRPYKRFGRKKAKRCHVTIKLVPIIKKEKKKK